MPERRFHKLSTAAILSARGPKNVPNQGWDVFRPYAFFVEPEHTAAGPNPGRVEDVATIFLTNRECPFHCLMCDLWKNTLDEPTPPGAIVQQIDYALARLPPARHIKLYNSGNFFDPQAIPPCDYPQIARRLSAFQTIIVENHPRLCSRRCVEFRGMLQQQQELEVALGLETVHPQVLSALNKQMTLADFSRAAEFLLRHQISLRAFILLKPPFLDEAQAVEWALRSIEFALDNGAGCLSVVPTRGGNGIMEQLAARGDFTPPTINSMEQVLEKALMMKRGRVFMDLWDVERFYTCPTCGPSRKRRLEAMNQTQRIAAPVCCGCADSPSFSP